MARVFKFWVECHPSNDIRPDACFEVFEQVRTAHPERILHFGFGDRPDQSDAAWVTDTIGIALEDLIHRTMGVQTELKF